MSDKPEHARICTSSLGEELSETECKTLATIMEVHRLKDNELLIKTGESNESLFVLIQGKLAVTSTVEGQEITVYTMSEGECAGTRAFVDRTPRKATLRAIGDTVVYSMKPEAFETLLDTHPRIVYNVMRSIFRITHSNLMRMNLESQELANYINKTGGRY